MRKLIPVAVLFLACGGASRSDPQGGEVPAGGEVTQPAATAATCETNLDAGTPCNPCPGSPRSVQRDTAPAPTNGVVFSQRECDCPQVQRSGVTGILWPSCPPAPPNEPQATCAGILAEYKAACGLP